MLTETNKRREGKGEFEKRQHFKLFNVIPVLGKTLNSGDQPEVSMFFSQKPHYKKNYWIKM